VKKKKKVRYFQVFGVLLAVPIISITSS
jgi:hypothetical protein